MTSSASNPVSARLQGAIDFAVAHETVWSRDVGSLWGIHAADPPPWNRLLGPVAPRGPVSGAILRRGNLLVSWGEPKRPELTISVAKTYLALLAGVAFDRGMLPDVDEPVCVGAPGIGFEGEHNRRVTCGHLQQ